MLIELHLLTSHAPANLNRDDFGRPKTAYFGGTERARISSQSQKRAIRLSDYVQDRLGDRLSTRSRAIPQKLFDQLVRDFPEKKDRVQQACEILTQVLGKPDKKNPLHVSQIVFLTKREIERIGSHLRSVIMDDSKLTGKAAKDLAKAWASEIGLNERPADGVDMALFGRMTTDDANAFAGVDAAMQVAHAIATHTTITETDYFTAVDDLVVESGERGSAHIGESDFNSAVFYKYFSCNLDQLVRNLGDDREAAVKALEVVLDAACRVTPTGKQNSFASHSVADVALLVVRDTNVPCSLANAFERAVPATENGYLDGSLSRLAKRYTRLVDAYDLDDRACLFAVVGGSQEGPFSHAERLEDLWSFLRNHTKQG